VLRSLATAVVLVAFALYYLLPLDQLASVPLAVILVVSLLILLAVSACQRRSRRIMSPWPRWNSTASSSGQSKRCIPK